ncbi:MAG: cation:proton antiporter [marine benthic group bacterium]|nr:cation:proton antiporter [Candidatus Carthagonibacter metallireducens]MCL7968400.1 cation:proton antiporter [Gemmatimonadota bacterium]MCL7990946.1 cation:proton antiporter [Gemmatimonadota bacterium]
MRLLLTVLALVLVSLLGARFGFRSRRASLGFRLFVSSGSHFVLVGFLLGPHVAGLITESVAHSLAPFIALGLGWIGLLFGLQFDRTVLRNFRRGEHGLVLGQALVTWTLLAGGLVAILLRTGHDDTGSLAAACAAAAAGCVSSPTGTAVVFGSARVGGPISRLASLVTSLDGSVGIAMLAAVYAIAHPGVAAPLLDIGPLRWILAPALLALLFGWLFLSLSREKPPAEEFVLFLLALALILAGTSLSLASSALFSAWLTGVFIANLSPLRKRVYSALTIWEKPVHVLFLVVAGALLSFRSWQVVPLVFAYVLLRAFGKLLGGELARPVLPSESTDVPFGATLLSQGGVSIAIAMSALLVLGSEFPGATAVQTIFDAVIMGIIIFEVAGPVILRRTLDRAGEISKPMADSSGRRVAATGRSG